MAEPDDEKLNYANKLYTSWENGPDPEFARAKCIRHSLKKLGTNPNEGPNKVIHIKESAPVVDPSIAVAEVEDDDSYTQHEEITSTINEDPPAPQSQTEQYNANDL